MLGGTTQKVDPESSQSKARKKNSIDKHEAALFPISFGPQEHVLN
jgi:hypothetical protein